MYLGRKSDIKDQKRSFWTSESEVRNMFSSYLLNAPIYEFGISETKEWTAQWFWIHFFLKYVVRKIKAALQYAIVDLKPANAYSE